MPTFQFVRHGETDHNVSHTIQGWQPSSLTENGRDQARNIAKKISLQPAVIISSDLLRCRETADIVASSFADIPLLYDWHFRERSFGQLEGQPSDKVDWDIFFAHDEERSRHNLEPESHMLERIKAGLRGTELLSAETILVVTHGGVLNRLGTLLVADYQPRHYENSEIIIYDIEYADHRLQPNSYDSWRLDA